MIDWDHDHHTGIRDDDINREIDNEEFLYHSIGPKLYSRQCKISEPINKTLSSIKSHTTVHRCMK